MGARFYDSSLNRWLSADTLVPEPMNPQSLNRYSYTRNNPLRYRDPTGHIEQDEAERAEEIIALLETYGILIEIDFWLQQIVMHPGPGDPSCCIWHKGAWELSTLEAVCEGVETMAAAMGGKDSFREALPRNIRFERKAQSKYGRLFGAETNPSGRIIRIFDRGVNLNTHEGLISTVVHELAHAWDHQNGGELSKGLEEITGGRTVRTGFWIGDFNVLGTEVYFPGSRPPPAAAGSSRGQDWAYSVDAWVYGDRTPISALTVDRQFYLRNRFPGIMGPQRNAR